MFSFRFLIGWWDGSNRKHESPATKRKDESESNRVHVTRCSWPRHLAGGSRALHKKTPARCRRHKFSAALVLLAPGNSRQCFLIFFLLRLQQRAIGGQESQLLLNDLVRIFRQV